MFVFTKSVKTPGWLLLGTLDESKPLLKVCERADGRDVMCHCQLTKHTLFACILFSCPGLCSRQFLWHFALSAILGWIPLFVSLYFFLQRKLSDLAYEVSYSFLVFCYVELEDLVCRDSVFFLLSAVCGRLCNDQRQDIFGCFDQGERLWSQKSKVELSLRRR